MSREKGSRKESAGLFELLEYVLSFKGFVHLCFFFSFFVSFFFFAEETRVEVFKVMLLE